MEKQMNVPKLRFPEFEGAWEHRKLGDVADISSGGTPSRTNVSYWNGNIPWISTNQIDFNTIIDADEKITESGLKNSSAKIFPKGTLLMAMYGQGKTRGKVALLGIAASTNQACGAIIPNEKILSSSYLSQNLSNRYDEIRNMSNQGGQENLSGTIIKSIDLTFPKLPEQCKLANLFVVIDKKISTHKKKKGILEQYKKNIMKQLFTKELRFKDEDGSEFTDWEEIKLGEICEIAKSGGTPTSTNREYYNGDIPFLSISDMTLQGKYLNYTSSFISKKGLENSSSWIVPINSIIYSMYASVGFVAINKIQLATSQAVLNLILKEGYNIEFVYYALVEFQSKLAKFITTGTQGNVNAMTVKGFQIQVPCILEQSKIATFLSSLDTKIAQTSLQIEKLQLWKKGLLQQMFV